MPILDEVNDIEGQTSQPQECHPVIGDLCELIAGILLAFSANAILFIPWVFLFYETHVMLWINPWDNDTVPGTLGLPGVLSMAALWFCWGVAACGYCSQYATEWDYYGGPEFGDEWTTLRVVTGIFAIVYCVGILFGFFDGLYYNIFGLHR
jgi:hypothetical protein